MRVAILGVGVMGTAFARQMAQKGHQLILCDRNRSKMEPLARELSAEISTDPASAVRLADVVLLAIKPKDLAAISETLKGISIPIILSILAGVSTEVVKGHFPQSSVIRSMPNLALIHGESVIALVRTDETEEKIEKQIDLLLEGMGKVFWTQESLIDAITALAGSGPAFVVVLIEAMVEAGIMMGLKASVAQELVLQTMRGAVALVENHKGHPGEIRWQISAPQGTTIAGIHAMEEEGIRAGMINTILATYQKTKEML